MAAIGHDLHPVRAAALVGVGQVFDFLANPLRRDGGFSTREAGGEAGSEEAGGQAAAGDIWLGLVRPRFFDYRLMVAIEGDGVNGGLGAVETGFGTLPQRAHDRLTIAMPAFHDSPK
jgi:hypothetical protein